MYSFASTKKDTKLGATYDLMGSLPSNHMSVERSGSFPTAFGSRNIGKEIENTEKSAEATNAHFKVLESIITVTWAGREDEALQLLAYGGGE